MHGMLGRRHEVEGDDSGDDGEHLGDSYVLGAVAVIGVFAITPAISDRIVFGVLQPY